MFSDSIFPSAWAADRGGLGTFARICFSLGPLQEPPLHENWARGLKRSGHQQRSQLRCLVPSVPGNILHRTQWSLVEMISKWNLKLLSIPVSPFQVNKMEQLEELHIKNLKIKSLQLGKLLLENLPKLQRASNWILEMFNLTELTELKMLIEHYRVTKGLVIEVNDES